MGSFVPIFIVNEERKSRRPFKYCLQNNSTFQTDITIEIDTKIFLFSLTNNWICFHIQIYEPLTVELITRRDVGGISDEKTIFQIGDNLSSGSGTRQGRIARGTGVNKPRTICQRNEWKEERNWHFWPSHWWMLRASFLLVSFRVIDIPSLPLEEALTIEWIAESCLCSRFIVVYA